MKKIKEQLEKSDRPQWGAWKIVSNMLDNPDEYGIYPTSKCYQELYDFVCKRERIAIEKANKVIELYKKLEPNLELCSTTGLGDTFYWTELQGQLSKALDEYEKEKVE